MSDTASYFEQNGYVVLKDALTAKDCDQLTQYMFKLLQEGKLVKDEQCPLSDAVYGDPVFDNILQKFAKPIGQAVGKELLPTYTYARIYRPGEILKKHKDRPACEISATMTLGYDAKTVWPIFFDEEKEIAVGLETGELAVYKGCDIVHWRTAFKGNWHVQVFFHYVDANGPYRNHVKDGRQDYGVQKQANVPIKQEQRPNVVHLPEVNYPKPIVNAVIIPSTDKFLPGYIACAPDHFPELMLTKQECNRVVSLVRDLYPTNASIGGTKEASRIDKSVRSADIYVIENTKENEWIYEKIAKIVSVMNTIHFDYEISGITHGIQLIHYKADAEIPGHYDWHVDAGNGDVSCRKISLTAQLTDPNEYEGCDLIINNHATEVKGARDQGAISLFPSYMPHVVTPITKGERYALVIWIHGSRRFR